MPDTQSGPDAPAMDPYEGRVPLVFGTHPSLKFPYDFLGMSPRDGDVIERHGAITKYERVHYSRDDREAALAALPQWAPRKDQNRLRQQRESLERQLDRSIAAVHLQSGSVLLSLVDRNGVLQRVVLSVLSADGQSIPFRHPFRSEDGRQWLWTSETIRHVGVDDDECSWHAFVVLPHPVPTSWTDDRYWTPEYVARSERLRRTSASTARHARRVRMQGSDGRVERIDPRFVFARDGWCCQLCGGPIDATLRSPDPGSASVDHVVPLARGGSHTQDNVQAAHLGCNVRKGANL